MKLAEESDNIVVCQNQSCKMRIHASCLGHAQDFPLWDLTDTVYCRGKKLNLSLFDKSRWFCPFPDCQNLAKRLYENQLQRLDIDATLEAEDSDISEGGKENMDQPQTSNVLKQKQKHKRTQNLAKSRPNVAKRKERIRAGPHGLFFNYILENVEHDFKESPLCYFGMNGEARMICSDSDLEDAMEEAAQYGSAALHLYST
mmetsp:Transcript_17714/g.21487  ORF Transcript_17714/g.21487 Transcript_17714/m.21487 type:complete len:201 (-) Transcript_17714:1052-1654(-)